MQKLLGLVQIAVLLLVSSFCLNAQCDAEGGVLSTPDGQNTFIICVGDSISNAFSLVLEDNIGFNGSWIITDAEGLILSLSEDLPTVIEAGGPSVCLFYFISFNSSLIGLEVGANISNISGCFDLSNPVTGTKTSIDGGELSTPDGLTAVNYCATNPILGNFEVSLTAAIGSNSLYLVTDTDANILSIVDNPPFDLNTVNCDICFLWHLSFEGQVEGLTIGANATDFLGCFDLSDPLIVRRPALAGGTLAAANGAPNIIACNSGNPNASLAVSLTGNAGAENAYILTDLSLEILAISPTADFNFASIDGNFFLLWHLSYQGDLIGFEVGANAAAIGGCFEFSNSISVATADISGGNLSLADGGVITSVCSQDGVPDFLDVAIEGAVGANSIWILTTSDGQIVQTSTTVTTINLDVSTEDFCLLWHVSYEPGLIGAEPLQNINAMQGCYALSNPISIEKGEPEGGSLILPNSTTNTTVCVGDLSIDWVEVELNNASGGNSSWVVSNFSGQILDIPFGPPFQFENGPEGICLLRHISHNGALQGLGVGSNINILEGCFDLSNPIVVMRNAVSGGQLSTTSGEVFLNICTANGGSNNLFVILNGHSGSLSSWLFTDTSGVILDLPSGPPFDLEALGSGSFRLYHMTYENNNFAPTLGQDIADLMDCYALSNPIFIERGDPEGGAIQTTDGFTEFFVCAGGNVPNIFDVELSGNSGLDSAWLVTNSSGAILDIPPSPPFNLIDAGPGNYRIYFLSYTGMIDGLNVGGDIDELFGCYDLSNPILVDWQGVDGGDLRTLDNELELQICVNDNMVDTVAFNLRNDVGPASYWCFTDLEGVIIDISESDPPFYLDNGVPDTFFVQHMRYAEELTGFSIGANIEEVEGCFNLSNPIQITKDTSSTSCITSLEEILLQDLAISIYPNPVKDQLLISVNSADATIDFLELNCFNQLGENVLSIDLNYSGSIKESIDCSSLASGFYYISIRTNYGDINQKIIVD